jgi:hypothetical protein
MKSIAIFVIAGAAALLAAGCTKGSGSEAADRAQADEQNAGAMGEVNADDSIDAAPIDMFAAPECVINPPPEAICTEDINPCGQASICGCQDGYSYNSALGKCVLEIDGVSEATFVPVKHGECVKPATGACTRDINACGQPSSCSCEDGFVWNSAVGMCVRDLSK